MPKNFPRPPGVPERFNYSVEPSKYPDWMLDRKLLPQKPPGMASTGEAGAGGIDARPREVARPKRRRG